MGPVQFPYLLPLSLGSQTPKREEVFGPRKILPKRRLRTGIWKTRVLESWGVLLEKPLNVSVLRDFFLLAKKLLKGFLRTGIFSVCYTEKVVETVEIQERILGEINGNMILIHNYET